MEVDFRRLLQSDTGRIIVSILLGLGLATLFRKICRDGTCIDFHGVMVGEIEDKVYQHDDRCYQYKPVSSKCNDKLKKVVDIHDAGLETFESEFSDSEKSESNESKDKSKYKTD